MILRKKQKPLICCNQCGQVINQKGSHNDFLQINKAWGYFSNKDLTIHSFNLCETCYDHLVQDFKIPVYSKNNNEAI